MKVSEGDNIIISNFKRRNAVFERYNDLLIDNDWETLGQVSLPGMLTHFGYIHFFSYRVSPMRTGAMYKALSL